MTVLTAASMSNINKDMNVKIGLSQQFYNILEEIYSRFLPKHQGVLWIVKGCHTCRLLVGKLLYVYYKTENSNRLQSNSNSNTLL